MENPVDPSESRLQETEVKLAYLERELAEYKDVVDELHARLAKVEKLVQELKDSEVSSRTVEDYWKPEEP